MSDATDSQDYDDDDDDHTPLEPEIYTTCYGCEDPLANPTTREEDGYCDDCDPDKPPKYWIGPLTPDGKEIDHDQAEPYRKLESLASDTVEMVLEWETPHGDTFISLPDGSIVDARDWIERPENLELGGGRDQYAGRCEFDPSAPERCWHGQTLPSGRPARPYAKSYDDVAELAAAVCTEVFERDKMHSGTWTVMLPGGEYVDAYDWAQRPETRQLAGCTKVGNLVRFRATATCPGCGASLSTIRTTVLQGEIGETLNAVSALHCQTCQQYLPPAYVPITLVDDASAVAGAPPRPIGDVDDHADGQGTLSGSLDDAPAGDSTTPASEPAAGQGTLSGSLDDAPAGDWTPPAPPTVSGELTGLPSAIDYAQRLAAYLTDLATTRTLIPTGDELAASLETTRADLVAHDVRGQPLAAVLQVQEAIGGALLAIRRALDQVDAAAQAAAHVAAELNSHLPVRHAYADTGNEAGADWFVQGE